MQALTLLAVLAFPPFAGSIAVLRLEGPVGFCVALALSLILMREAILVCMILMRRWRLFGRDLFLIEQDGRERWVDAEELKAIPVPCRVHRRQFMPDLMDPRRDL